MSAKPRGKNRCNTIERVVRTVQVLQRLSCYATLLEVHAAVCKSVGRDDLDFCITRDHLRSFTDLGVVKCEKFKGSGKTLFYYWTGGGDLLDQQQRAASPLSVGGMPMSYGGEFPIVPASKITWTPPDPPAPMPPSLASPKSPPPRKPGKQVFSRPQKATFEQVAQAIADCGGNKKLAAKCLGVSMPLIYKRLAERPGDAAVELRKYASRRVARTPRPSRTPRAVSPPPVPESPPQDFAILPPPPQPVRKPPKLRAVPLASLELPELWRMHRAEPDDEVRAEIADRHIGLARYAAQKMASKLPAHLDADDLLAAATFGLLDAIDGYDPDRGVTFNSFSAIRIRGAILDSIREDDWVPRLVRSKNGKLNPAREKLRHELGREPAADELAAELDMTSAEADVLLTDAHFPAVGSMAMPVYQDASGRDVEQATVMIDRRASDPTRRLRDNDALRKLTRGLNQDERLLILLYYWEDKTMWEIGEQLCLSESRISQMHTAILERLRRSLPDKLLAG